MTTSLNAITEPADDKAHMTRSSTTTTHNSTTQQRPEDQPRARDQDPNLTHTQASGSPGNRREPCRAAVMACSKINFLAVYNAVAVTDGHRTSGAASC